MTSTHITYAGEERDLGIEYLLTVWDDGTHELAVRTISVRTWSPPVVLKRQSAEASA